MNFRYYAKQNLIKRSYDLITDLGCIIKFDKKKYLIVEQLSDQNIYHTNKTITIYFKSYNKVKVYTTDK